MVLVFRQNHTKTATSLMNDGGLVFEMRVVDHTPSGRVESFRKQRKFRRLSKRILLRQALAGGWSWIQSEWQLTSSLVSPLSRSALRSIAA